MRALGAKKGDIIVVEQAAARLKQECVRVVRALGTYRIPGIELHRPVTSENGTFEGVSKYLSTNRPVER
jgi:hypothetical protein